MPALPLLAVDVPLQVLGIGGSSPERALARAQAGHWLLLPDDDDLDDDEIDDEDEGEDEDEDDEEAWGDEPSDEPEWQVRRHRASPRTH